MKGIEHVDDTLGIKYDVEQTDSKNLDGTTSNQTTKQVSTMFLDTQKDRQEFIKNNARQIKIGSNFERGPALDDQETEFQNFLASKSRKSAKKQFSHDRPTFKNNKYSESREEFSNDRHSGNREKFDNEKYPKREFKQREKYTKRETSDTKEYNFFAGKQITLEELENDSKNNDGTTFARDDAGIETIRKMIDTVWKSESKEDLAEIMSKRILFEEDDLIAFDKPYFLAYAGSPREGVMNMIACLETLRTKLWPDVGRLQLVRSLDKQYSGIILLAKSDAGKKLYQDMMHKGLLLNKYYALVKGIPNQEQGGGIINIPLVKIVRDVGDILVKPFSDEMIHQHSNLKVIQATSQFRVIETNKRADVAFIEVAIRNDQTHQIRSHLSYGLNCPLVGDYKYNLSNTKTSFNPPQFTDEALNLLDISNKRAYKKVPMLCHLGEMTFGDKFKHIVIDSPMPNHMKFVLNKLRLLKK